MPTLQLASWFKGAISNRIPGTLHRALVKQRFQHCKHTSLRLKSASMRHETNRNLFLSDIGRSNDENKMQWISLKLIHSCPFSRSLSNSTLVAKVTPNHHCESFIPVCQFRHGNSDFWIGLLLITSTFFFILPLQHNFFFNGRIGLLILYYVLQ